MHTQLTRRFGITHPVMSAGMARIAQAPLVAAVSEAGGMGCLGGVSFFADDLRDEIAHVRRLTTEPFAVNLLVPPSMVTDDEATWAPVRERWQALSEADRRMLRGVEPLVTPGTVEGQVEVVLAARPAAVVLTFDVPDWFVAACHERDIAVMALVGSVGRAEQADVAGVDFVIAQGTEGGGHTGHVSTMVLLPAVVDAVSRPVLAAGGIVDGRTFAAARCLGAEGAWMGTRFVATHEAYGHDRYKQRIVDGHSRDTVLTTSYTGKPLRTMRNEWTEEWAHRSTEVVDFPAQYAVAGVRVETGYQDGDVRFGMMPAGQGVEIIHDIRPAGDVVRSIIEDAEAILARASGSGEP